MHKLVVCPHVALCVHFWLLVVTFETQESFETLRENPEKAKPKAVKAWLASGHWWSPRSWAGTGGFLFQFPPDLPVSS